MSYFTGGTIVIQNKDFQLPGSFSHSRYVSGNVFWKVTQGASAGVEYSWGARIDANDQRGDANRLSFLFYYDF